MTELISPTTGVSVFVSDERVDEYQRRGFSKDSKAKGGEGAAKSPATKPRASRKGAKS